LYAISLDSAGMDFLSSINPLTGSATIISPVGLAKYVTTGVSTIDPVNKRFYFLSPGDTICAVDLITGDLLAKNKNSLSGTYDLHLMEFNCLDTTLYAISLDSTGMDFLSTVDPMTGSTTIISPVGLAKYVNTGVSTLDPVNNRFFFLSTDDTIYSVDITTGNLLAKNLNSLSATYTNHLIEFRKPCPGYSNRADDQVQPKSSCKIFPNPFQTATTFYSEKTLQDATLTICNILGQKITVIKNISGHRIEINRNNLSNGCYFIRLTENNKIIATQKIIITD
jgi:hypothetical protein